MSIFTVNQSTRCFGGKFLKLSHPAKTTGCNMNLNVFLPPQAESGTVPVLFFLAGLTSTQDNAAEKAGLQRAAAKSGIAVVYPDTSPRGLNIPGEDTDWDLGTGAGLYINATQEPWTKGYNMDSYVSSELYSAIFAHFPNLDSKRAGISGFSMGGHGALTLYLKNPDKYRSVSAFAPLANPIHGNWGRKTFSAYFGPDNIEQWKKNDATELIKQWPADKPLDILIETGADDKYLQDELMIDNLLAAAKESGNGGKVRSILHPGYDHSYYMVSTFIEDHLAHHSKYLLAQQ